MMLDHARAADFADSLTLPLRLGGLAPIRLRRPGGDVYESAILGRMTFVDRPPGLLSFWCGSQRIPGSAFELLIACHVEADQLPSPGHEARLVAMRRFHARDAVAACGLINAGLRDLRLPYHVGAADLVLTSICLPSRPMVDPRDERIYGCASIPALSFTVTFVLGTPISAYIVRS
jgi:hypothetical protein